MLDSDNRRSVFDEGYHSIPGSHVEVESPEAVYAPRTISVVGRDGKEIVFLEDPQTIKPFVIVESPYMGATKELLIRNIAYARACVRDSILRGEAPFGSHLLYTQPGILRDEVHAERELGMGLGWHIMRRADLVAIYTDLGWSSGMTRGRANAVAMGRDIVERQLGPDGMWQHNWDSTFHCAVDINFPNLQGI